MIMADGTVANAFFTFGGDILLYKGHRGAEAEALKASVAEMAKNAKKNIAEPYLHSFVREMFKVHTNVWSKEGPSVVKIEGKLYVQIESIKRAVTAGRERAKLIEDARAVTALEENVFNALAALVDLLEKRETNLVWME